MTQKAALTLFPNLFAVWRPAYGRWQMCQAVRGTDGTITRLIPAYGPWLSATLQPVPALAAKIAWVPIGGREVEFVRERCYFVIEEISDREVRQRRVPILRFVNGGARSLPRGGI